MEISGGEMSRYPNIQLCTGRQHAYVVMGLLVPADNRLEQPSLILITFLDLFIVSLWLIK